MRFSLLLGLLAAAPFAYGSGPAKEQVAAGAALYASSGCAHCHGANTQGGIGPSLAGVGRRLKPEELQKQVHDGGGAMPAFGDVLTGDQIDQLVAWLRTKREKTAAPKAGQ